jgi:cell division protein ZapA
MKHTLSVQIMDHTYQVESSADDLYVNRLAQYVEEKMKAMREESGIVDSYKLAVMAAMNIADELLTLQENKSAFSKDFESKTDELVALLNTALETPAN